MPDDTSLTDNQPVTPAVEYTPPTREEWEAMQGKYGAAQKDIAKFRTRAEQVEAAQKAAEAEALKNKPLEEQLKALQAERDAMLSEREQLETRQAQAVVRNTLFESGVPKDALGDAEAAFRAWLEDLSEEEVTDATPDALIQEWLESRPHFKGAGATTKPATATGAPGIGAKPVKPPDFARATPSEINAWFDAQPKKR